jgi:hypothetical protein
VFGQFFIPRTVTAVLLPTRKGYFADRKHRFLRQPVSNGLHNTNRTDPSPVNTVTALTASLRCTSPRSGISKIFANQAARFIVRIHNTHEPPSRQRYDTYQAGSAKRSVCGIRKYRESIEQGFPHFNLYGTRARLRRFQCRPRNRPEMILMSDR